MTRAPILVLAVGNPSRGDDALGPLLAERLERAALPGVEVLCDFQLQVEHVLDLEARTRVIFVDACVDTGTASIIERDVRPETNFAHTSHSLGPGEVLETYRRVTGREAPPATLLGVHAERFELGEDLSTPARQACAQAWPRLLELCRMP